MIGTFGGALEARKIDASTGRLRAEVKGEIESDQGGLVIAEFMFTTCLLEPSRPGKPWNAFTAYTRTSAPFTRHCGLLSKLPQILNLQGQPRGMYSMTLQQKLDDLKSKFESSGPTLPRSQGDNRNLSSGYGRAAPVRIGRMALKTGDRAPAFTLNNQERM